jgi:hypothetical protein
MRQSVAMVARNRLLVKVRLRWLRWSIQNIRSRTIVVSLKSRHNTIEISVMRSHSLTQLDSKLTYFD